MESIPISPLSSHASPPSDEEVREVLSSNFAVAPKKHQDKPDSHQASETSWSVVSATAGLHSKSPPREPSGYLILKQAREAHRAKSCLSPPVSGGLQPPSYKPSTTATHEVDYIQPGLPQPRPKAPPLSLRRQTWEKRTVEALAQTPRYTQPQTPKIKAARSTPPLIRPAQPEYQKALAFKAKTEVEERWIRLLQLHQDSSLLAQTAVETSHPEETLKTAIKGYSASSLLSYIRQLENFTAYIRQANIKLNHMSLAQFTDFLWACKDSQEEDRHAFKCSPSTALKALSWFHKIGQIEALSLLCINPLTRAFVKPDGPTDRKEAIPLPLAVLAAWEVKLLDPNCPTALAILLGAFLLTAFCSLRFGDTQRICISSLSLTSSSLRGTCWTTKTSSTGQPFACTHFGITGRDTATAWTVTWLAHLQDARLETQKCYGPDVEPDFLIPAIEHWEATGIPVFHCPLQYHQALQLLRWMVQTPWTTSLIKPEEAQSFTMHSLKVSLLSASAQLRLPEESRRLQGHHKTSSTQLYSRDDTIQSLWLQREIALNIRQGWRPPRPQARGGQAPTIEPAFTVSHQPIPEQIILAMVPPCAAAFIYHREVENQKIVLAEIAAMEAQIQPQIDEEAIAVEAFAEITSSDDDEEPCEQPMPPEHPADRDAQYTFVQLFPWGAIHAAPQPRDGSNPSRTACGRKLPHEIFTPSSLLQADFCRRSGCKQLLKLC